jgi:predicted RNase H-like HicB family nuclease
VDIRQEDGAFWATVDEYPGVLAAGDDLEGLRASLAEGIRLMAVGPDEELPELRLSELKSGSAETPTTAEIWLARARRPRSLDSFGAYSHTTPSSRRASRSISSA